MGEAQKLQIAINRLSEYLSHLPHCDIFTCDVCTCGMVNAKRLFNSELAVFNTALKAKPADAK